MKITVRKPAEKEREELMNCPVWECGPSSFNWYYDSSETCLVFEGKATVETDEGSVSFGAGNLVIFPKGLSCIWHISETIEKHYLLK
jgi:uncharacterized protein